MRWSGEELGLRWSGEERRGLRWRGKECRRAQWSGSELECRGVRCSGEEWGGGGVGMSVEETVSYSCILLVSHCSPCLSTSPFWSHPFFPPFPGSTLLPPFFFFPSVSFQLLSSTLSCFCVISKPPLPPPLVLLSLRAIIFATISSSCHVLLSLLLRP